MIDKNDIEIDIYKDNNISIVCTLYVHRDDKNKNKTAYKRYFLKEISIDEYTICQNWSDASGWSEAFNGFCRSYLQDAVKYSFGNAVFSLFVDDRKAPNLRMTVMRVKEDEKECLTHQFSKMECLAIYSKMSKILSRCDIESLDSLAWSI